ncbi:phosphogluconate dehydrogenase (NAD(+)-dependent, decarboxylating) [Halobacillus sp. A5]|uniref:phosphogluconate dehydrogenase (NAD(+)-dependent, decarboxylating) n=1 Tax=Halobacillus sp. A5 TaxID=2880263 RepID=UPI0020A692ED|nr:decarboxylating 6-phosphogluconate dehydrogenase [Halobacillus sp. A5]MCP3028012.1 decarboxylating 6-phosphogluconate dehydrogenase [Halobacillus sp. A5]
MKIGMVGLGKMGLNLTLNLLDHDHEVVGYDTDLTIQNEVNHEKFFYRSSLEQLVTELPSPKVVWVMVPAGEITEKVLNTLSELLDPGDMIIDGGNSNYKETLIRAEKLGEQGIYLFDCGTSGGTDGARSGACTMIGGHPDKFKHIEPVFEDVCIENGYLYTGKPGSGHFLKMVHNGIEYGMMQAIGEGFDILHKSDFDYDYEKVAKVWNHGSVVRSWLMELMEQAFSKDGNLDELKGVMNSSGEGKWTVETALDLQSSAPIIALSLMMRYRSQEDDTFSGKVVAALRNEFGGHAVVKQ